MPAPTDDRICSAKGCRNPAAYELRWNNPKIHTPDRRKIWLACQAHRDRLSEFLDRRGFLIDVNPIDVNPTDVDPTVHPADDAMGAADDTGLATP